MTENTVGTTDQAATAGSADQTSAADGSQDDTGWVPPPWEPPVAGTEVEHLLAALDRQRATFRWKADGLDAAALNTRIGASALTLGGLLKHLALVVDEKFTGWLSGAPLGEPWAGLGGPPEGDDADEWVFGSAAEDSPADLYALYDGAVQRSHQRLAAALANGGLDQPAHIAFGDLGHLSLRRLLFDLLEEYGRHTGHADLLREAVDGRVGEDPPMDWRP
ncbi:MAG: DinB family protein [Actinomycetota bacterium]|nr:DinB family protein [Actinomycetota bacterium]